MIVHSENILRIMGSDAKPLHMYVEKAWNIRKDHVYYPPQAVFGHYRGIYGAGYIFLYTFFCILGGFF